MIVAAALFVNLHLLLYSGQQRHYVQDGKSATVFVLKLHVCFSHSFHGFALQFGIPSSTMHKKAGWSFGPLIALL